MYFSSEFRNVIQSGTVRTALQLHVMSTLKKKILCKTRNYYLLYVIYLHKGLQMYVIRLL